MTDAYRGARGTHGANGRRLERLPTESPRATNIDDI